VNGIIVSQNGRSSQCPERIVMEFRLPRWLRLILFALTLFLAAGLGVYTLREAMKPVTLKLAMGSLDTESVRVMTALSRRMATTGGSVRLSIVEKPTPIEAAETFAAREADLAVVRGDNEELASARAVVQLTSLAVMILVPPNSPIKTVGDLRGKTVGVLGLTINRRVLAALVKNYGFAEGSVQFVDIPLFELLDPNRQPKKYQAAIFIIPLADRYNSIVRAFFPPVGKAQPRIIEIDSAEAIAMSHKYLETFDMPKGTLRGAPPLPDDAVSTLRVPAYLVAHQKISESTIGALAKSIMEIRRELLADTPILAQVTAPDDDANASIPIHPGAKAFFDGSEKTWSDKYGDWLFYGTLLLGVLGSLMAGVWKFLTGDDGTQTSEFNRQLTSLLERIRNASTLNEIDEIDRDADDLLGAYMKALAKGQVDGDRAATLSQMIGHLQNAIDRRGRMLRERRMTGLAPR
jgi:TRAP-type uncharacterized transport system substrate-binding protein